MSAPDDILQLVDQFASQLSSYRSLEYNEAQVRNEFVEPFFAALGWDVYNKQGFAFSYKDVIYEDSIKVGGATKAPDYAFRIGGTRKFFVEAKKPSVSLKDEITPAYQLRRYAWSAHLPLSILTDFEEFAVYDCRPKPNKLDKPSTGRIKLLTYRDYASQWDEIYSVFSKQAVLKGSFDQYAEAATGKRGTAEVDDAFLAEIERWRDLLAHNIALRNPSLSQRDLNYAIQMTIDRLIFLRICEDRGIEFYGQLQSLLNGGDTYARLCQMFRKADERYNSGLFHFHPERDQAAAPDTLTPTLLLDDKPLKDILGNLYYPDSPYEFSVLPADILGQVYERFLGKVIRLTPGHHAVVEDKPEVKKAGGVFYTPTFIVDYIVKNTLGKQLEGKLPGQVGFGRGTPLRVLDMSCGSGSFLLGAYQYLLDWYLGCYSSEPEKWSRGASPRLYQVTSPDGALWKLTTSERKRILLDHIYGVDIDPQAVEVTKLSLLLKVLEGENEESIGKQLSMFRQRALPDLAGNIKCGNSLIGPDFYTTQQATFLDAEEQYRINAFDWKAEFAGVFVSSGGFDIVIGNPPYGIIFDTVIKPYLEHQFPAFVRNNDTYVAFVQKCLKLFRPGGLFGFIIPNTFLLGPYFDELKRNILQETEVIRIVDFGTNQIFPQPNVFTLLLFLRRIISKEQEGTFIPEYVKISDMKEFPQSLVFEDLSFEVLNSLRWAPENQLVLRLMHIKLKLGDIAWVKDVGLNYWSQGRGKTRGGSIADRVLYSGLRQNPKDLPYLKGRDVDRFAIVFSNHWLRHDYQKYLDKNIDTLRFSPEYLNREKIVYRQTSDHIIASIDTDKMLTDKTLHTVVIKDNYQNDINMHYLLGILNSSLLTYYYKIISQEEGRTFAQVKTFRTKELPIILKSSESSDVIKISSLVECMLSLHQQFANCNNPTEQTLLQRQIDNTDQQIDALVYELYGLTDEEIRLVESN